MSHRGRVLLLVVGAQGTQLFDSDCDLSGCSSCAVISCTGRVESIADVVFVSEDSVSGGVDMADLRRLLAAYKHRRRRIGMFTAASNVTGTGPLLY